MIYEKSCGAAIFHRTETGERRWLLERMQKGHTSMCKGHMEGAETEHETAVREIREETGLTVRFLPGFRRTIRFSPYPGCRKTVVFFLAEAETTETAAQPEEVREIVWLPFAEALTELTHESDRDVRRAAEAAAEECGRPQRP